VWGLTETICTVPREAHVLVAYRSVPKLLSFSESVIRACLLRFLISELVLAKYTLLALTSAINKVYFDFEIKMYVYFGI
jgi:hypothetical protein